METSNAEVQLANDKIIIRTKNKLEIATIKSCNLNFNTIRRSDLFLDVKKKLKKPAIFNQFFNKKWSTYFGIRQHSTTHSANDKRQIHPTIEK